MNEYKDRLERILTDIDSVWEEWADFFDDEDHGYFVAGFRSHLYIAKSHIGGVLTALKSHLKYCESQSKSVKNEDLKNE